MNLEHSEKYGNMSAQGSSKATTSMFGGKHSQ